MEREMPSYIYCFRCGASTTNILKHWAALHAPRPKAVKTVWIEDDDSKVKAKR